MTFIRKAPILVTLEEMLSDRSLERMLIRRHAVEVLLNEIRFYIGQGDLELPESPYVGVFGPKVRFTFLSRVDFLRLLQKRSDGLADNPAFLKTAGKIVKRLQANFVSEFGRSGVLIRRLPKTRPTHLNLTVH